VDYHSAKILSGRPQSPGSRHRRQKASRRLTISSDRVETNAVLFDKIKIQKRLHKKRQERSAPAKFGVAWFTPILRKMLFAFLVFEKKRRSRRRTI